MPAKTADMFLDKYWNYQIPVNPRAIAENAGLVVKNDFNLLYEGLSGKIEGNVISINPRESAKRQRFTIAHEIGHYALNHGEAFRDPSANFSLHSYDDKEIQANAFAAELLMPEIAINHVVANRTNDIDELARLFNVSVAAMRFRLKNLGWL